MTTSFTPYLNAVATGRALSNEEMQGAMHLLLNGAVSDIEASGFLMALRARGETVEEISAAARVMRDKALPVKAPPNAVDTCGTGGAGKGNLNVSTAASLVAAGCGVPIAKHGNKAASSKSGGADVLEALGVNLQASPDQIAQCIDNANVGFMFARAHHKAVAQMAGVRSSLGVRTLFNLLGPLSNPAGAKRQVMGVYAKEFVEPLARVLLQLGAEAAWVVHGEDGLDEITTTGKTFVAAVDNCAVKTFTVSPGDAALAQSSENDLKGGDPDYNAEAIRRLLDGEESAFRDIAVLNAGAVVLVGGLAATLKDGAALAQESIDSGKAKKALDLLVHYSNADPS